MKKFLNVYEKPVKKHYRVLLLNWAGWVFDFYDLIFYTFLMIQIKNELNFSDVEISFVLGASLAITALGVVHAVYTDRRLHRSFYFRVFSG